MTNSLFSLRFAISSQGARTNCVTCDKVLVRGECLIFVVLNDERYFYLGLPPAERPECCGKVRDAIAVFDEIEDAIATAERYRKVFLSSTTEEELFEKMPLKPIPVEKVPAPVLAILREQAGGHSGAPLH